ncbi:MMPL family transporter [Belliella sp. DSM 107340]|uniref:MMPL family transporter n=1 Tax=Belliella calami TaxID=2923436 RepID=A0ABS9URS7_9BACT|nr:MMPL family transporter [Belliella calami]MCH7399144.1 MMPL family transporter [Belliella calami]
MFERKASLIGLGIALSISVMLVLLRPQVVFDYDFEQFFPQEDEDLTFYQNFREKFENDNDYLLIALGTENGIFDPVFLDKAMNVQTELEGLEFTERIVSLLTLKEPIINAFGVRYRSVLDWESEESLQESKQNLTSHPQYSGNLISEDGRYLLLVLRNEQLISKEDGDLLYQEVNKILGDSDFHKFYTAGKIKAQGEFVDLLQEEFAFFLSISIVLIMLLLLFIFRTWWGVLLPLIVLLFGIGWTIAIILLTGKALDVMSVMQPTILLVIGLSALVHYLTLFMYKLRLGIPKDEAIRLTFKNLFLAIFLTCFTTALGFSTLYFTSAISLKLFGIYTALGVMVMFVAVILITPGLLYLFSPSKVMKRSNPVGFWQRILAIAFRWIMSHKVLVLASFSIVSILSVVALANLKINGYLLDNLPREHELVQEFEFFDKEFGGSKPLEFFLEVGEDGDQIFQYEVLKEIEKLEDFVQESYESGAIISPFSLVKLLNQAQNSGNNKAFAMPSQGQYQRLKPYLSQAISQADYSLISEDQRQGRLSTRTADIGSYKSAKIKKALESFVDNEIDGKLLKVRLTGTSNLIDKSHVTISDQMTKGLGVAILLVGLIAGFLFRSWRISFLILLPNVLPLLWMCGVMWFLDIDLKLTTAVIFTVAFGIAVDDSIHFMTKLQAELKKGRSILYALKRTYLETGKAIVLTSVILVSGFLVLTLSEFGVTFYTGLLISLALVFAVLADLMLLPILLLPMQRIWNKRRVGFRKEARKREAKG